MDGLGRLCLLIKKTYLHSGFFDINHHNVNNLFNDFANRKFNVIMSLATSGQFVFNIRKITSLS